MHPKVQEYINRINANDPTLTDISLEELNLCDDDMTELMAALAAHLPVAHQITMMCLDDNRLTVGPDLTMLVALECLSIRGNRLKSSPIFARHPALDAIDLSGNQLTSPPILKGLTAIELISLNDNKLTVGPCLTGLIALQHLAIQRNNLTDAYKIALNAERLMHDGVAIDYDNPIDTELTLDILNSHFKQILSSTYSLTHIESNADVTEILKELNTRISKNRTFVVDMKEFKVNFNAIADTVQHMFPENELVSRYINNPNLIKQLRQEVQSVLEENLEALIDEMTNYSAECVMKIIYHSSHGAEFTFVLAQKLLHDIYLRMSPDLQLNSLTVNWLIDCILFLKHANPHLILAKEMEYLMCGHPTFINTITPLMTVFRSKNVFTSAAITTEAEDITEDINNEARVKRLRKCE